MTGLRGYDRWKTTPPEHIEGCGEGEYPCEHCGAPVACEDCAWCDELDAEGRLIGLERDRHVLYVDDAGVEAAQQIDCRGKHECRRCAAMEDV